MKISLCPVCDASRTLVNISEDTVNGILLALADRLIHHSRVLLDANAQDLAKMSKDDPKYDRLLLNEERIEGIARDICAVAALPNPLGRVLEERTLDNGLQLSRVTVPLGVVGVIYEARPNVTFDVFSLCFKSGNAVVLKGGADADASNRAAVAIIREVLREYEVSCDVVQLLLSTRESVEQLLEDDVCVDVIIPRGSKQLIDMVRKNSRVPVIETGAGIVHTYLDESADIESARNVITNAKTRRVSVCNALDTLIVHERQLQHLPYVLEGVAQCGVEVFADPSAFQKLQGKYPAELLKELAAGDNDAYGVEFLALKMAIKTVSSLEEAINHIITYSSRHSEAILSKDPGHIKSFVDKVDAAVVYVNTSTAFTDGAQFGLGAEIGISTQKLHARGPMGLRELTSYKWIVRGEGQVRA